MVTNSIFKEVVYRASQPEECLMNNFRYRARFLMHDSPCFMGRSLPGPNMVGFNIASLYPQATRI